MHGNAPHLRNLPWLAAVTAMGSALLLGMIRLVLATVPSFLKTGVLPEFGPQLQWLLSWLIDRVVLVGGVAFVFALWHSGRSRIQGYGETWLLLCVFALAYLVLDVGGGYLMLIPTRQLTYLSGAQFYAFLQLSGMLRAIAEIMLAWLLAAFALRSTAQIGEGAPIQQRARVAGLNAWLVLMSGTTMATLAVRAYNIMSSDGFQEGLLLRGGLLALAALVMLGSWLGLPRNLPRLHGGRLLGMSLLGVVSVALWLALIGLAGLFIVLGNNQPYGSALLVALGVLLLFGPVGLGWLWARLFYRRYRLAAS